MTRHKHKKADNNSPDILSKIVDVCGHCGKKCSGKDRLNEAVQYDLCASCEGVSSDVTD